MKYPKNSNFIIKFFISVGIIVGIMFIYLLDFPLIFWKPNPIINNENIKVQIFTQPANQDNNSFTLIDQNGKKFKSSALKGCLSLIYFGVTYSVNDSEALKKLSDIIGILEKEHIVVRPIFITLDPKHDTTYILKKYLEKLGGNFIGLTGTVEDIKVVAENLKVFVSYKKSDKLNSHLKLEHSHFVYLINSDGKLLKHYCLGPIDISK